MNKNKIKNWFEKGISSNGLKIIGIIFMVIDHLAYYFQYAMPNIAYIVFRGIGRMTMPIFVYVLVQGFFFTKNYKKYVTRIFGLACITQICISLMYLMNRVYFSSYVIGIASFGNILFTFTILLLLLKVIHEEVIYFKWDKKKNVILRIIICISLLILVTVVPIDYGSIVLALGVAMYMIERLKIMYKLKKYYMVNISDKKLKIIYNGLLLLALLIVALNYSKNLMMCFAIIPIYLYNFEKGKNITMFGRYTFYIFFPIQHIIIYLMAMVMYR